MTKKPNTLGAPYAKPLGGHIPNRGPSWSIDHAEHCAVLYGAEECDCGAVDAYYHRLKTGTGK